MFIFGSSLIARTKNPVGGILFLVGIFIFVLGFSLTVIGNREVEDTLSLWRDERLSVHKGMQSISAVVYPFHLESPSTIRLVVSGKAGSDSFDLALTDSFATAEVASVLEGMRVVRPKIHFKDRWKKGEITVGPLNLPPGSYTLKFENYPLQIEASFSLKETHRTKPYESFYHLGLTLLEVGIPIFITGIVSLGYGTLVPT